MGRTMLSVSCASALSIVEFGDPIGAAEAIVRIGLAVAAANRLKTLAVLAGNAELGNGHACPGWRRTAADWEAHFPAAGSHHRPLSHAAPAVPPQGCPAGHCVRLVVRHRDECQHRDETKARARAIIWPVGWCEASIFSQVAHALGTVGLGGDLPQMNSVWQGPFAVQGCRDCTWRNVRAIWRLAGSPGIAACLRHVPAVILEQFCRLGAGID